MIRKILYVGAFIGGIIAWNKVKESNRFIVEDKGVGKHYYVDFSEGLRQIRFGADNVFANEDVWIYNSGEWVDVGKKGNSYSVIVNAGDLLKHMKNEGTGIIHSHPKGIEGLVYNPPSTLDLLTGKLHTYLGIDENKIGCVDSRGVWFYNLRDIPAEDLEFKEILRKYNDLCISFLRAEESSNFDFNYEKDKLIFEADKLGISLNYIDLY